jgi:hypothetical protein
MNYKCYSCGKMEVSDDNLYGIRTSTIGCFNNRPNLL